MQRRRLVQMLPPLAAGAMLVAWQPLHAAASEVAAADARAVRAVIQAQLSAFAADDAKRAFALAAPGIRAMFGTPDHFLAMVRSSYPVVYRPASVTFLQPQRDDVAGAGDLLQRVQLTDADGRGWMALYRMQRQPDRRWRINGCELSESRGRFT